ncbi:LacI family DNA-binding transcriptional regulator [Bifidobacterium sp. ESL0763]|uniref:LacI family DNA-binding transcriptional regulator n=1 Tax=Bifidobacterium sp. ESL0763 TaxID=2983227 RepID=UPI0023F88DE1|nr:LacI family DNA-binding transcriptional regulator [Bifidobacterium sp. ESL0763]MDF7664390.1 LacI family DNA-binding transcriptional regulator [Bifidobacterium sp. ESL0763]
MATNQHSQETTIRDVAKAAGVAPSTVSRAFSRPGRVKVETAQHIFDIADALGYRTKRIHSCPPAEESKRFNNLIAIVVADLANPVFAGMVKSVLHECSDKQLGLLVLDSEENGPLERDILRQTSNHVDGVILASSRLADSSARKIAEIKPVITINRPIRGIQSIVADIHIGLLEVVNHLHALGHTGITYLAGPDASWQNGMRWRSLTIACKQYRMKLHRITCPSPNYSGGYRCFEAFRQNPTTAVVGYNDLVSIGFIAALKSKKINVPGEVSVVGIDNTSISTLTTPALTTIDMPHRMAGKMAAQKLIATLLHCPVKTSKPNMKPVMLPTHIIKRTSTGQASKALISK